MANLQTEFSLDDIKIARDVRATYPCGMSRVALNAPDQVERINSSWVTGKYNTGMVTITYRTLKMQYAIEVWLRVIAISNANPGPLVYYWWLDWKNSSNGFRSIVYNESIKHYNTDPNSLISEFMDQLRRTADSGEVKVHEFCRTSLKSDINDFQNICEPTYEVVVDAPTANDISHKIGPVADYKYNTADVSYSWDDIKDYFCILTLNQLRLVNLKHLHKPTLWDEVLFEGADNCNISMIQYALDNGANILSLDSMGESALVHAVSNARYIDSKPDIPKIIETIDFLLSKGADIDAFGDGIPPLMEAYYANSPELVKFLIKRGANVNFNCYLMDNQYWPAIKKIKCSLLEDIETSICDDYTPEMIEIEQAVREAGGEAY